MADILKHNKIAEISLQHFYKLPKTGKPTDKQWTILSTIVKENIDNNSLEVVALGTGTKCIGVSQMSITGDILNDSHAEIICRRSFLKYLYFELQHCISSGNKSDILNFNVESRRFLLRDSERFHFFTTHVPCGDAAIFYKGVGDNCSNTTSGKRSTDNTITNTKKKFKVDEDPSVNDIYRTGAKCLPNGEIFDSFKYGAGYHTVGLIRTKPGRGDPTLSLSCSDKISKWCYLGIQGGLLALLLEKPIYLKSFTVAGETPYSEDALQRAFIKRFRNIRLCSPFERCAFPVHQSKLGFEFKKTNKKMPCPSSISWWKNARKAEVSVDGKKQGVTKKLCNAKESRLSICKLELMRDFLQIAQLINLSDVSKTTSYNELKLSSVAYQNAWNILRNDIFKGYNCKDPKLLNFTMN